MPESVASEVVSAMVGGMFSASALYPLEVLKTRMQAETKSSSSNSTDGAGNTTGSSGCNCRCVNCQEGCALRKVLPNEQEGKLEIDNDDNTDAANNASNSNSNSTNSSDADTSNKNASSLKSAYQHAASEGMSSYAKLIYDNEGGIAPFYAGVVTSAVQSATEKALYFFAYTFLKNG